MLKIKVVYVVIKNDVWVTRHVMNFPYVGSFSCHVTFNEPKFPYYNKAQKLNLWLLVSRLISLPLNLLTPHFPPSPQHIHQLLPPSSKSLPPPTLSHPMTTRSCLGITKPRVPLSLYTSSTISISQLSTSHFTARNYPNWHATTTDKYRDLMDNKTLDLVPWPFNPHVICCMWLFWHKFKTDSKLQRYKARLVISVKCQQVGINCAMTFTPWLNLPTSKRYLACPPTRC